MICTYADHIVLAIEHGDHERAKDFSKALFHRMRSDWGFDPSISSHKICTLCNREIEWSFKGKKLNSKGFCVGFDTCLQDASI
jgi:ribosome-associated toxin RatA of RatAB toxin-antitoxin module